MNEIKILSDRIIIDGHADTREQCETATMLANLLSAQGSGFNCVEYRSGYAEFKKSDVAKLADGELKFISAPPHNVTMIFDSGVTSVTCSTNGSDGGGEWTSSGQSVNGNYDTNLTYTVALKAGYVIDTVISSDTAGAPEITISEDKTSFYGRVTSGSDVTVTITTVKAAFDGKINITKSAGVVLKTEGKYCDQDITVVPTLEEKSVTPTESAQEITPSDGNCGISKLNVGAVQTETKTITPTTSQQTFTPTSGKYFKQVICQAIQAYQGTATPARGEQTITPTSGKFFSSFKVGAIPSDYVIPSGTLQITANGAKDVTNYKNVNVNVEPNLEQKTVTITTNGTTDVTPTSGKDGMSKVIINTNVPTASAVEEVATASAMDALLVEANVGKYYKYTGTTDSNYTNGDLYLVEGAVSSGYTVSYTNSADSRVLAKVRINGGEKLTITDSSGTFENVQTIQFFTNFSNGFFTVIKSTTLGLNQSGESLNHEGSTYILTQNVNDIEISSGIAGSGN